jgi:radical SAM-linked protein
MFFALYASRFTLYDPEVIMDNIPKLRMRLRFARLAGAGNMSHLEQIQELRRIAAGSGLDCCPAKHGRDLVPKMAFGPALSAGCGSRCEYADLYLAQSCPEIVVMAKLSAAGSEAFELLSVKRVPVHFPSIEASVSAARYCIEAEPEELVSRESVDAFLALESVPFEKKDRSGAGHTLDARPLVLGAELDAAAGTLRLVLKLEPGKNVKPLDVLGLIAGREAAVKKVVREDLLWLDSKGGLEAI